ncbi:unnamed protein product, partial [Ceratitis capitata]
VLFGIFVIQIVSGIYCKHEIHLFYALNVKGIEVKRARMQNELAKGRNNAIMQTLLIANKYEQII